VRYQRTKLERNVQRLQHVWIVAEEWEVY